MLLLFADISHPSHLSLSSTSIIFNNRNQKNSRSFLVKFRRNLLANGASVKAKDHHGRTALHEACRAVDCPAVEVSKICRPPRNRAVSEVLLYLFLLPFQAVVTVVEPRHENKKMGGTVRIYFARHQVPIANYCPVPSIFHTVENVLLSGSWRGELCS